MNADLTFNSIVFKKAWDNQDESLRQSTARGVNTPDKMSIKTQSYVDCTTKVAGRRYTLRVDRFDVDANLQQIVTSAYVVIAVPVTATSTQLTNVVTTFKAAIADADLVTNVLNDEK